MEAGAKLMLASVGVLLLAAGGELLYLHHRNAVVANMPAETVADGPRVDPDNLVYLKREQPHTFKDIEGLKGRTLWVSAGDQLDYYSVHGRTIDFSRSLGTLFGAEPLQVDGAVQQALPVKAVNRVPRGDRQVFLLFHKPNGALGYAVPVGSEQAGQYTFITDDEFFYDDPRKLFSDWGSKVWEAIDQHKVILGMSERQSQMALGQVVTPSGQTEGERDVDYDNGGHNVVVTYVGNKATKIDGPK